MLLYATMTLRTATQIPVTVQLLGLHWIKNKAHLLACILSSAGLTQLAVPVLEERGAQGSSFASGTLCVCELLLAGFAL